MSTSFRQQEDLLQLSSTLSKMLKQKFGKGPESCFVTNHSDGLTVYIRNFITPAEEVLIESNQMNLAYNFRHAVIERVFKEFSKEVVTTLGLTLTHYYNDWDYHNNTGIMLLKDVSREGFPEMASYSRLKSKLLEKISYISAELHKVPSDIRVIKLNQNMYAVECQETLLHIEKVLYKKNCMEILQERSREIKQSYINKRALFTEVFGRGVEAVFMTWDYENNCNYIFFYLQP
ncbi:Na-translocating system protein MpsC family protein [Alkalihalobacterium elongatum]|uniref:Na-translocating system protein MpsC family protein n=1 Tax=Alkalihalobacterium elongatum TaxID=2675466 RepID=UPI001C1FD0DE|nr:Na-translocating system protein MpsC family protein [Alkalihalobacterium elongatum]